MIRLMFRWARGRLRWVIVPLAVALLLPIALRQQPAVAYSTSDVYTVTTPSARRLPVARTAPGAVQVTTVSRQITVSPGDIVQVFATTQVTTPYKPAVMVGRYLQLGSKRISRTFATNITAPVHHLPMVAMASVKVTVGGTFYIRHVLYAASSAAGRGWRLQVDYAELQVTVLRA